MGVTLCLRNTIRQLNHELGFLDRRRRFFFFFYIYKMEAIPLCLRNTIEQLDHTLGLSDRRRRIFFLLLHLQDGVSFIMIEKHDQTAKSNTGALRQKKNNFFSSFTYTGWGEKKYSTSHTLWYLDRRQSKYMKKKK